jgi:hypothetical protein
MLDAWEPTLKGYLILFVVSYLLQQLFVYQPSQLPEVTTCLYSLTTDGRGRCEKSVVHSVLRILRFDCETLIQWMQYRERGSDIFNGGFSLQFAKRSPGFCAFFF